MAFRFAKYEYLITFDVYNTIHNGFDYKDANNQR